MNQKSKYKFTTILILFISITLLIYTGYRSYALSFTHDESFSFINYVHSSVFEIISYNVNPLIANNHVLNTLSMKWFGGMFGYSEFVLRLHSLIAHLVYLIFTYLILKEFKSTFIILFGFIILNCNPYLLDFFSLARGYALSISLMIACIYFFIQYTKEHKLLYIYVTLILSVLGVLANFSLISFSASIIILLLLITFKKQGGFKLFSKNNIPIYFTLIVLSAIYLGPIKILIDNKQLNFGGESGLWIDTVCSSIICYLYSTPYSNMLTIFLKIIVAVISISSILLLIKQYKANEFNSFSYISIILCLIVLSNVFQHLLLKGSFFRERFALFLVPLFFFTLLNVIYYLINRKIIIKSIGYIVASLIIICSLFSLYSSANLNYCLAWKYDSKTREIIEKISSDKLMKPTVSIGVTWLFEPTINFYKETQSLNWLETTKKNSLTDTCDYYYVEYNDFNSFDKTNKEIIETYTISGTFLFKKTN